MGGVKVKTFSGSRVKMVRGRGGYICGGSHINICTKFNVGGSSRNRHSCKFDNPRRHSCKIVIMQRKRETFVVRNIGCGSRVGRDMVAQSQGTIIRIIVRIIGDVIVVKKDFFGSVLENKNCRHVVISYNGLNLLNDMIRHRKGG